MNHGHIRLVFIEPPEKNIDIRYKRSYRDGWMRMNYEYKNWPNNDTFQIQTIGPMTML